MLDIDWINMRAAQSFPLADTATGISKSGTMLPQSFLLDIRLLLPAKRDLNLSGKFYISAIQDRGNTYTVIIAYHPEQSPANGSGDILCALCNGISKTLTLTSPIAMRTYTITPLTFTQLQLQTYPWLNKITGSLCAGTTQSYFGGSLFFTHETALIHALCISFMAGDHLLGIQVGDKFLTGVVLIRASKGVLLKVNGNIIQIGVNRSLLLSIWTSNITDYFVSIAEEGILQTPIRSINGIYPDANGNFNITGVLCVKINALAGGITINNSCATPCCTVDTSKLNMLLAIKLIEQLHQVLRDYYVNMATTVNYMQANLSTLMGQI